ncbi:osteoclast stimulatory transmembrane protein-like [Astyanax mexicanus]|uniref:Osteoclast stimulatory transmembrane protein-like n=1 Tax=Astyanax mexicanus TaxID=7994 RepID=A0A8T2LU17_ASTMX|nr:osteoclast stimulatory transmembrane protein-like [Astyanax mexicanus]
MDLLTRRLTQIRMSLQPVAGKMAFAWNAYSKPCPSDACEMLLLILLCVLVSSVISSLLFAWMTSSLAYDLFVAGIVAGTCACVMLVLLILVHPVRCVITVTVPALGTKQGRKIILSTALLYAITSCVPNITHNVGQSLHMLKCSTGNITHSMLKSAWVPNTALHDINDKLHELPSIQTSNYWINLESGMDNKVKTMERDLAKASENVRVELAQIRRNIGQTSQVLKKSIAALFVLLMIGSSVTYVNSYLTQIKHDNVYQSKQLMEALRRVSGDITIPECYQKKLVKTSGLRMSAHELKRGLWGMMALLIYVLMCGLILGLDHFVYWSLQSLLAWASDIPDIHATVYIDMSIKATYGGLFTQCISGLSKSYPYTVQMMPRGCVPSLSAPDHSTLTSVCAFLATGFLMVLGEVFARRLRRKVCASFYRSREEHRTQCLLLKILNKRKRPAGQDD